MTSRDLTGLGAGAGVSAGFLAEAGAAFFAADSEARGLSPERNVSVTSSRLQENASAAAVRMTASIFFFSLPRK